HRSARRDFGDGSSLGGTVAAPRRRVDTPLGGTRCPPGVVHGMASGASGCPGGRDPNRSGKRDMTVHFVGAGPGAADLLTLRAVELLRTTPVCLYAGTYIDAEILAHCPDDAELVDTQHLDLDQIIAHLVDADRRGLDAVRLCSGDPSLYSALTEQTRRLDEAGVAWDVTPGVPAYAAAAALLGTELTVPEVAQTVVLTRTRARSTKMPESEA